MVEFSKLRLAGFKSFVEPTEILIDSGLTGIVGPNGCGKSNVVEALRWVMGENSAKRMRGNDMDDVIFAGTSSRPSRNFAEAQITLKTAGSALASRFPDADEIVVSRRIDRGSGSTFRINGKETRAGDVRLLFADIASGAQSASIVAQGKVASLIDAKPTERRALLEEAAGTTGLASRRREAETRLKAAESNLTRVGDLTQALGEQLTVLEGQSVDAEKYRKLSDDIRDLEALQALVSYHQQSRSVERARESVTKLSGKLADVQAEVTALSASTTNAAAALPALRNQDAEAAAKLQRLIVERESVERETTRVAQAREENERASTQLLQDVEREKTLARDADSALERLGAEKDALEAQKEGSDQAIEAGGRAVEAARESLEGVEEQLSVENQKLAKLDAETASQKRMLKEAEQRAQRLVARAEQTRQELEAVKTKLSHGPDLEALKARHEEALAASERARVALNDAKANFPQAQAQERHARDALNKATDHSSKIKNEHQALAKITQRAQGKKAAGTSNMLSDGTVTAQDGFERALAAILGSGASAALDAQLNQNTPAVWTQTGEDVSQESSAWPSGVTPLIDVVQGPKRLARLFAISGVADDIATATALQSQLQRGQILTSKAGGIWRWDGFASLPGAEERAAAERLAQVKRVTELEALVEQAQNVLSQAQAAFDNAKRQRTDQDQRIQAQSLNFSSAQRNERDAETALLKAEKDASGILVQHQSLCDKLAEAQAEAKTAAEELAALPSAEAADNARPLLVQTIDALKAKVSACRQALNQASGDLEQHKRDAATREARLGQIFSERHDWEGRQANAQHFQRSLAERQQALKEAAEKLAAMPAQFAAQKSALNDAILGAEKERKLAADVLATAEAEDKSRQVELRKLESEASALAQEHAGTAASLEADEARLREIIEEVREEFGCGPQGLYEKSGQDRDAPMPNKGDVERKLKNRQRDRDALGAVNLRAELERDAMVERLDTLAQETVELESAIAKLRASIAEINQEGRQRLAEAFDTVNDSFKECFTKLFGGGKAELRLLEDKEDPLNSGLEIYAQPPGKKVSSLSLMSGGERSLAAIALIFALFRSNPAPVCVLDEVDAPLDDHNVGRFVDLVGDMAAELGTRFLVVTHHAVTMAKMDRLYGVTMGEPGVSNAYSVDLARAELALAS